MKLNLGRRIVLFVYWLASLIVLATLVVPEYVGVAASYVFDLIPMPYLQYVVIGLFAIYLLLSLLVLGMVFKGNGQKRSERGFITVDSADTGKVRIAIGAIESMVKQAIHTVDGIADMKISIGNADDAISIQVNVTMVNGSHVPTVTLNMQRAIRQFVEMNCGVAVRSVSISIQSVTNGVEGGKKNKRQEAKPAVAQPAPEIPSAPVQPEPEVQVIEPVMPEEPEIETVSEAVDETAVVAEEVIAVEDSAEDEQENKEEN